MIQTVEIDSELYSQTTIEKALYPLADKGSFLVSKKENSFLIEFNFEEENIAIIEDFKNNLIDYSLREKLSQQTENYKNLILAQAFSETDLLK